MEKADAGNVQFQVSIPMELREILRDRANARGWSLNSEIMRRLMEPSIYGAPDGKVFFRSATVEFSAEIYPSSLLVLEDHAAAAGAPVGRVTSALLNKILSPPKSGNIERPELLAQVATGSGWTTVVVSSALAAPLIAAATGNGRSVAEELNERLSLTLVPADPSATIKAKTKAKS